MVRSLLAILALLAAPIAAAAQTWPERAVRIVVPFPAGGNVDVTARIIADQLQKALGQPFVIENRAGAGGVVGNEMVSKAAPDGYTLLLTVNGPLLFAAEYTGRKPYDWRRDFIAITPLSLTPLLLQIHPSLPARTLAEFIALAKSQPGALRMASPGLGSMNHLLGEMMQVKLALSWVTVHYRGNAPAMNDLVGGHVQMGIDQASFAAPFIRQGQSRALAVTSTRRLPGLPEVATFAELGHPDLDAQTFTGLMAPAGVAPPVVEAIHAAVVKVLADPPIAARLAALGADAAPMTPAQFRAHLEKEDASWLPLIRKLGIKSE